MTSPPLALPRRTKIVATLGPATDPPAVLEALILAGVDVVRCNFSHGVADDHRRRITEVRAVSARLGRDVAILGDLQGPKVRIGRFAAGAVLLETGSPFTLHAHGDQELGDVSGVGTSLPGLARDVNAGDTLLLADGLIELLVEVVQDKHVHCRVMAGGVLRNLQGLNRKGGGLSAPALTEKDLRDIALASALDVDYLAVSFVRCGADLEHARTLLHEAGGRALLMAKIERAEAVAALPEVLRASDAVMVARGDLGVEIGDAELPGVQKSIIALARELNRPCVTATQMMESMVHNPVPTRAEVLDVANAVMDGTDAVMLSAETATGAFPVKAVMAMDRVCRGAERQSVAERSIALMDTHFGRTDEAIAMATAYTARHAHVDAVIALTESGNSALMMSRMLSEVPIYALTGHDHVRRRMALYRDVVPVAFERGDAPYEAAAENAVDAVKALGALRSGHRLILTQGTRTGSGGTDTLKLLAVP